MCISCTIKQMLLQTSKSPSASL
uniref:Uncharacterized protein n=1 Tax=Anguilla anguilla TaxID=7936 RepID=A0A0E9RX58_ANGAN